MTNNDVQNTTHKTEDRATRTLLNTRVLRKGMQFLLYMWLPLNVFEKVHFYSLNLMIYLLVYGNSESLLDVM